MAGLKDFLRRAESGFDAGMDRVTLTKGSPEVAITEQGLVAGTMQVNLHWTTREPDRARRTPGSFWRGLLHPNLFKPYIRLSRDDRSGGASGETMYIDLSKKDSFRRLLVFVYIYDETPAFDRTHALVTLFPPGGRSIEVKLDQHTAQARSCAVALIENHDGVLKVRREAKYVYGFQAELDRLYGWGLQWQRGYKPVG